MKLTLSLTLLLSLAVTAQAQTKPWPQEPYDFRGLSFGLATESEATQTVPVRCRAGLTETERMCEEKIARYGELSVDYSLHFLGGYLEGVMLTFKQEDWEKAREQFIGQFGKAHEQSTSTVKDRDGNDAQQETLRWTGKSVDVTMTRVSSARGRSNATIGSNTFWKYIAELSKGR